MFGRQAYYNTPYFWQDEYYNNSQYQYSHADAYHYYNNDNYNMYSEPTTIRRRGSRSFDNTAVTGYYFQQDGDTSCNCHHCHHHHRHGVAGSALPPNRQDRKKRGHRHRHKSHLSDSKELWMQPMIMDPMMSYPPHQQILDTCATPNFGPSNAFNLLPQPQLPVPMIHHPQPYFVQIPNTNYSYGLQQPSLLPNLFNDLLLTATTNTTPAPTPIPNINVTKPLSSPASSQEEEVKAKEADEKSSSPTISETAVATSTPSSPAPAPVPSSPASAPASVLEPSTALSPAPAVATAGPAPPAILARPMQRPLQRRKSMMESLLSSFSFSSKSDTEASWGPNSCVSLDKAMLQQHDTKSTGTSLSSSPPAENVVLSRRASLKLSQKMKELQTRQYIWCYKPQKEEGALWTAFDVKNQTKLDNHYAMLVTKKQHQQQQNQEKPVENDPTPHLDEIFTLNKQSQLPGPVTVSLSTGTAWCYDNDSSFSLNSTNIALYVACLPSQQNRFVVPMIDHKNPTIRRSKSVDGLGGRLLNNLLKW